MTTKDPIAGAIVSRGSTNFMVVRSGFRFPGQPVYGLVELDTGSYNSLSVDLLTLKDILEKAQLDLEADSFQDYLIKFGA